MAVEVGVEEFGGVEGGVVVELFEELGRGAGRKGRWCGGDFVGHFLRVGIRGYLWFWWGEFWVIALRGMGKPPVQFYTSRQNWKLSVYQTHFFQKKEKPSTLGSFKLR